MDNHEKCLQDHCGICGNFIELKTGYLTKKTVYDFSNILFTVYNIDIELESSALYPKYLCGSCKRKLDRLAKKNPPPQYEPFNFTLHDGLCKICERKSQTLSKTAPSCHVKFFDEIFGKNCFTRISNVPDAKLFYSKLQFIQGKVVHLLSIKITESFNWSLLVYGNEVPTENTFISSLPLVLQDGNIQEFVKNVTNLTVCSGLTGYNDIIKARLEINEPFVDDKGNAVAILENQQHVAFRFYKHIYNL